MERERLETLDALRGFAVINMVLYHGIWDLLYIFGVDWPFYSPTFDYIWQQMICWSFILISGFSYGLGKRQLKRGLILLAVGTAVSVVTELVMPENRIRFGVLTCLGSCTLVLIPVRKLLEKVKPVAGLPVSFAFFLLLRNINEGHLGFEGWKIGALPLSWYRNDFTAYLGFPSFSFYSTDYFSLFPWLFLFMTGFFLYRLLSERNSLSFLQPKRCGVLGWIGRHSLPIYVVHQPLIYGILWLLFSIT